MLCLVLLARLHPESRDEYAEASGRAVMELLENNLRPRDIVTRSSLVNAARIVASSGGSTNAALHLPAMAHEAESISIFLMWQIYLEILPT